ncbi:MAG: hybrid sensor histidine kinase/response regulator [Gemmatimonadaceae bacterium]
MPIRERAREARAKRHGRPLGRVVGMAPVLLTTLLAVVLLAGVLQWRFVGDRAGFQYATAAIDNAARARLHATRAFMIVRSIDAGDRTFTPQDAEAALDRARLSIEDWKAGRTAPAWATDAPLRDAQVRRLADDYLRDLEALRSVLRDPRSPARDLALRRTYARVEARGDSIENRAAVLLREHERRDRLQHEIALFLLAFAIVFAGGWLHHVASTTRARAERERLVQRLTTLLAVARTPEDVARAVAEEGIRTSGASHGSIGLVTADGTQVQVVARAGDPPPGWDTFPLTARVPAALAITSRRPVFVESRGELHDRFPDLAGTGSDHICAISVVPLEGLTSTSAGEQLPVLGYLSFSFTRDRRFSEEERRFLAIIGDITAQAMERAASYVAAREARDEAHRERQRLALILDQLPIGVSVVDTEGRMVLSNHKAHELLGQSVDVGEGLEQLTGFTFHRQDGTPYRPGDHPLVRALRGEGVVGEVMRVRTVSGREFPLAVTAAPVPVTEGGQPSFAVGAFFDIAPLEEAQHAMRESEARLRQMAERVPVGIFVTDATGKVTYGNPRLAEILGAPLDAILRDGIMPFVSEEDRPRMEEARHAFRGGGPDASRFEFRVRHAASGKVRQLVMESSVQRSRMDQAEGAVGVIEDVTEQRTLEAQLAQSQKMEAIGRLAGGVAHDFNNLLTVMLASTELLLDDTAPEDPRCADLRDIRDAVLRASELTGRLLAFSRRQVIQPRAIDVNVLARGGEKLLARVIGEDVKLELVLAPSLPPAHGDPGQLQQALMNLAVNARDAMPHGGVLRISTRLVPASEVLGARPGEPLDDAYVALVVSDTGVGIEADVRERVFEPFFTTKEVGKGTGLGLSMVYGAVAQMGGRVGLESEPGKGSAFYLYLPLAKENQAPEPPPAWKRPTPPAARAAVGRVTVLLVEDDPALRGAMQRMLERAGFEVLPAEGAEEALALARSHAGRIHLVLTDVVMKGAGGREAAEAIARVCPEAAIAFMSGYTADVVLRQRVSDGEAFIQKPFTPDELVTFVRGVIGARKSG